MPVPIVMPQVARGRKPERCCKNKANGKKGRLKECRGKATEHCLQSATDPEPSIKNRATMMVGDIAFEASYLTRLP